MLIADRVDDNIGPKPAPVLADAPPLGFEPPLVARRGRFSGSRHFDNSDAIATYNVNGINGRLGNLLAWLEEVQPDIVCLQELKVRDEKFPGAVLRAAGYGAVWHGQKSCGSRGRRRPRPCRRAAVVDAVALVPG